MDIIKQIEREQMRTDIPAFKSGDTVKVHLRIVEGEKERIQVFQGNVIRIQRGTTGATFTVRKISDGVGVERILPLHSPFIDHIEVVSEGRVRRHDRRPRPGFAPFSTGMAGSLRFAENGVSASGSPVHVFPQGLPLRRNVRGVRGPGESRAETRPSPGMKAFAEPDGARLRDRGSMTGKQGCFKPQRNF